MKKVSIVVPIYKVEKYLNQCIESIVNQTYKNLEIILVDDGSPDNCPKICDEWAKKDKRIKVIHKDNQGLGMARNTGIENATGDYICFFDSDDYVSTELVDKCVNKMEKYKTDFVVYGFCDVTENGLFIKEYVPNCSKKLFKDEEVKSILIKQFFSSHNYKDEDFNLLICAWNCMFSMNLIKKINFRFVSERKIISEDVYSMLIYYSSMSSAYVLSESLFYHRYNGKSLTHEYRKDRFEKLNILYIELLKLCDELGLDEETKNLMSTPYLNGVFGALKLLLNSNLNLYNKYKNFKIIVLDKIFQESISCVNFSQERFLRMLVLKLFKYRMTLVSFLIFFLNNKR